VLSKYNTKVVDKKWQSCYNTCIETDTEKQMSIEALMLDTGMNPSMTEFEQKCYGMSEKDMRVQYMESFTAKAVGPEMVAMGILSDCQEMLDMGTGPHSVEYVRKQINRAKFILSEMMEAKRK
jgi:hypothetical protein